MSFGTVRISEYDFSDDAVIFAKTPGVLARALESLSEVAEPLGLRVFWIKTEFQALDNILDATIESILVSVENVEVTQTFTYLGSVIHSSTSCGLEVNRRSDRDEPGAQWSRSTKVCGAANTCPKGRRSGFFAHWST